MNINIRNLFSKALITLLLSFGLSVGATPLETVTYEGQLKVGKNESVIMYLGSESGDLAAFCFSNKSAAGRAILAKCKNGKQCRFTGQVNFDKACDLSQIYSAKDVREMQSLSASGRIISVKSARSIGK